MLRHNWWKIICVVLLIYTITAGFLGAVPAKPILNETIRNLYFHVAMWFTMMVLFTVSVAYSVLYLRSNNPVHDVYAVEYAKSGIVFGCLGLVTGSIWAKFTWGHFWSNDPKQLGAAIAARAQQSAALMAILGFPLVIPQLLLLNKISNIAFASVLQGGLGWMIVVLVALDVMIVALSLILFPFLWKD